MRMQTKGVLVVAGWLLMSPPLVKDPKAPGGYRLDSSAKVPDWNQVSAHDSATDCERAKAQKTVDAISMAEQISGKKNVLDLPVVNAEPLRRELEAFVGACRGEAVSYVDGRQGRAALATALAIAEAAAGGGAAA